MCSAVVGEGGEYWGNSFSHTLSYQYLRIKYSFSIKPHHPPRPARIKTISRHDARTTLDTVATTLCAVLFTTTHVMPPRTSHNLKHKRHETASTTRYLVATTAATTRRSAVVYQVHWGHDLRATWYQVPLSSDI